MTPRRFKARDMLEVNDWYQARKIEAPFGGSLPEVGYIIDGVAAGFLFQTDSQLALIEGLIANPRASKDSRDRALNLIVGAIERTASEMGFTHLVGLTRQKAVLERARKNFFRAMGDFTMVAKEIGNGLSS